MNPKYSIIIPTYNNCNKYLVPCINSIFDYTDSSNIEVIISANGCTDNTREYLGLLQNQHPGKFKIAWSDEPLGYPKATNAGIRLASADKIILLNNDIVLLPQEKNTWINILEQPFHTNPKCGIVGDIKIFSEAANHDFAIFFCVMIKREVFDKIGLLNEEYGIGMGEDIEFCIEAEKAGYEVIEPLPKEYLHDKGIWTNDFPIEHFAEGTMHDTDLVKDYGTHYSKNLLLLAKKYNPTWYMQRNPIEYSIIIPTYNHCDGLLKPCLDSIFEYTDLSNVEIIVSANGCTDNTKEYLESLSDKVKTVWSNEPLGYPKAVNEALKIASGNYIVLMNNDVLLFPQEKNAWINMLHLPFEDASTGITGPVKFSWKCGVNTHEAMAFWLVMIRRDLFNKIGLLDEVFSPGMGEDGDFCIKAVQAGYKLVSVPDNVSEEFESGIINTGFPIYHVGNGTFGDDHEHKNSIIERNNRILQSRYGKNIKTSIIIPTYNHLNDSLKPCIESVLRYTNLDDKEIIVVANGCTDGTREYLDSLADVLSYIWFDRPTGVVRAYNTGIDAARGEFIVTFDNDSYLLPQRPDEWIDILMKPFLEDDRVGGTSPFANYYEDIGLLLHSGCTMYRADILREIGKFDEAYNPGYFCDPDVAAKIWEHGYKCVAVPEYHNDNYVNNVFVINFPVVHEGNVQTMDKNKDIEIVKMNREILYSRHGKRNS